MRIPPLPPSGPPGCDIIDIEYTLKVYQLINRDGSIRSNKTIQKINWEESICPSRGIPNGSFPNKEENRKRKENTFASGLTFNSIPKIHFNL